MNDFSRLSGKERYEVCGDEAGAMTPENRRLYAVFHIRYHYFADPRNCPRRWPWRVGRGQPAGGLWLG